MDKKVIVFTLGGVIAGMVIGYLLVSNAEVSVSSHDVAVRRTARAAESDQSANVAALRKRIQELERRLADTATSASTLTNAIHPANARFGWGMRPPNMSDFRAHMEDMKLNDPEGYAHMTNRMARWRSHWLAQTRDRMDFLSSLDTSAMTTKELENHENLQSLIARSEELMQMMEPDNPNVTDEQREKSHQEMSVMGQQIKQLEREERDMLLKQTARNLGCKGAVAKELVETIKTIYEVTQSGGGRHGPPPPGGPR